MMARYLEAGIVAVFVFNKRPIVEIEILHTGIRVSSSPR